MDNYALFSGEIVEKVISLQLKRAHGTKATPITPLGDLWQPQASGTIADLILLELSLAGTFDITNYDILQDHFWGFGVGGFIVQSLA